jgi:hypothetical protein
MRLIARHITTAALFAILATLPLAADEKNLLQKPEEFASYRVSPPEAAQNAKQTGKSFKMKVKKEFEVGTIKAAASIVNSAIIPVGKDETYRCRIKAEGDDEQTATIVLYYYDEKKQLITGAWTSWRTGLKLTSRRQEHQVDHKILGEMDERTGVVSIVGSYAGGTVSFIQFSVLIEGEGTAEISDLSIEKLP